MLVKSLVLVGLGGALGSMARFAIGQASTRLFFSTFPIGTLFVNLFGCLVIGVLFGLSRQAILSQEWRLFMAVGFCGGFTTFSSFSVENLSLIQEGQFFNLALYSGTSVLAGLFMTWLGLQLTKF